MKTNVVSRFLPALALATALASSQAACVGSFGAFNKVQGWNKTLTGNRVVNSVIHTVFWLVPVYELTILGDLLIFNTVEFATGSNPIGK